MQYVLHALPCLALPCSVPGTCFECLLWWQLASHARPNSCWNEGCVLPYQGLTFCLLVKGSHSPFTPEIQVRLEIWKGTRQSARFVCSFADLLLMVIKTHARLLGANSSASTHAILVKRSGSSIALRDSPRPVHGRTCRTAASSYRRGQDGGQRMTSEQ